ncbi:hypothetical protein TcBrA4_0113270 [Trypanosoma cruzi]|nr:hypothetical protein TcBrA4_0113270 [Trypanosoma cruzi]
MGGGISNANQRENAQDDDVNEKRQWRFDEGKRKFITSTVNSSNKGYTEGVSDPLVARGTPDPVESTTSRSKLTLAKGNSENPSSGAAASSILVKGAGNSSSTNTMRNMRNASLAVQEDTENPTSGAAASSILVKGAGNSSSTNTMRNMRNASLAVQEDTENPTSGAAASSILVKGAGNSSSTNTMRNMRNASLAVQEDTENPTSGAAASSILVKGAGNSSSTNTMRNMRNASLAVQEDTENPTSGAAASSILVKGAGNSSSTNTMRNMRNAFVAIVGDGAGETVESEKSNLEGEPGATTSQGSVMNVAGPFICQSYNNAVEKTKGLGRAPAPGFFRSVVGPSPVVSNLARKKVTSFLRPCVATGSEEKTSRDVAFDPPAMPFVTPSTGGGSARGPLRMRLRIKQGNEGRPVARADTPEKGLLQKSGAKNKTVPPSAPYNLDFEW